MKMKQFLQHFEENNKQGLKVTLHAPEAILSLFWQNAENVYFIYMNKLSYLYTATVRMYIKTTYKNKMSFSGTWNDQHHAKYSHTCLGI